MWSTPAEATPTRSVGRAPVRVAALLAVLLTAAQGCVGVTSSPTGGEHVPADVLTGIERTLDQRTAAVRAHRRGRFLATVTRDPSLRAEQGTVFANLADLPVQRFSQRLVPPVRSTEGGWAVRVRTSLRLAGFDRAPVHTEQTYTFVATPRGWRVGATSPTGGVRAAWADTRLRVVRGRGVLLLADADGPSRAQAERVVRAFEAGVPAVRHRVPLRWDGSVVVRWPSSARYRAVAGTVGSIPGGDAGNVDALSHRVRTRGRTGAVVGTRVLLNPGVVGAGSPELDRLARHELTHVALGGRNDRLPGWLGEGLAEFVAARSLPSSARAVPGAALVAVRSGTPTLPTDADLRRGVGPADYALAWWACEALAQRFGADRLWAWVAAVDRFGADRAEQELGARTGWSTDELAAQAARAMRAAHR